LTSWLRSEAHCVRGVGLLRNRKIGDNRGMEVAGSETAVREMVNGLDRPVMGKPDGIEMPTGSRRVLAPAGAEDACGWPGWTVGERGSVVSARYSARTLAGRAVTNLHGSGLLPGPARRCPQAVPDIAHLLGCPPGYVRTVLPP
jgi:hypothetical protein